MSEPILASQANANTNTDAIALQAIANMRFISQSVQAINNAISQGLYFVTLTTLKDCNLTNLINYYHALGYQIVLPDMPNQNGYGGYPLGLWGLDYVNWLNCIDVWNRLYNPTRFRIQWAIPNNPIVLPVISTKTANYTILVNNETVFADTALTSFTVSLPASPVDGWVETITKSAAANTLTISGNGHNINGASTPLSLTALNTSATLIYTTGYGWSVFPNP